MPRKKETTVQTSRTAYMPTMTYNEIFVRSEPINSFLKRFRICVNRLVS